MAMEPVEVVLAAPVLAGELELAMVLVVELATALAVVPAAELAMGMVLEQEVAIIPANREELQRLLNLHPLKATLQSLFARRLHEMSQTKNREARQAPTDRNAKIIANSTITWVRKERHGLTLTLIKMAML